MATERLIRRVRSVLPIVLLGLVADACAEIAFLRLHEGHWQVWRMNDQGQDARPLTASPWDKRGLRSTPGSRELRLRDSAGGLYVLDPERGQPLPEQLPGLEVAKDLDFHPDYGYLVSTYAPNAMDNLRLWWYAADGSRSRLILSEAHLNHTPRWLPGGRDLVYVHTARGHSALYRTTFSQPRPEQLFKSDAASSDDPCPSPDGRWLAFCRETQGNVDLWIARPDGTEARELHTGAGLDAEPAWSADGRWVLFATWQDEHFRIARIRSDGRAFTLLTAPGYDARCPVHVPNREREE